MAFSLQSLLHLSVEIVKEYIRQDVQLLFLKAYHFALDLPVDQREEGTAATTVLGRMKGASIFRVHDVKTNYREMKMIEAILEAK